VKLIPIAGSVFALGLAGYEIKKKGLIAGVAHVGLDMIPLVGTTKGVIEIFAGDLIPDKTADRRYDRVDQRSVRLGGGPLVEVNDDANGRVIELPLDGELKISLKENPTTGFSWMTEEKGGSVCELVDDDFESPSTTARGSGGVHRWRLKAKQKGEGKIVLSYRRSWETKPPLKTFTVTIRVN
jgi:inhibitor of cysteine peptidase